MKFNIELSWSKLMALVVIGLATWIDIKNGTGGNIFMFSVPFVVFLITGKQLIDMKKK